MRVVRLSVALVLLLAVATVAILLVTGTTSPAKKACISAAQALSLSPGIKALPPSHDNDAGRARLPDATPDADFDAGHHPTICTPSLTP